MAHQEGLSPVLTQEMMQLLIESGQIILSHDTPQSGGIQSHSSQVILNNNTPQN